MKNTFLLLTAVLVLFTGGCSLAGDDAPDGTAGLRLLVGGGQHKTVSDPAANDWSPQMVYIGTNRYLYFLSDRGFTGQTFSGTGLWLTNTNPVGNTAIFRVREVVPGVYSNLQMWFSFGTGTNIAAIITPSTNSGSPLFMYVVFKTGITNFSLKTMVEPSTAGGITINPTTIMTGPTNVIFPAGRLHDTAANKDLFFFGRKNSYSGDNQYSYLSAYCYENSGTMLAQDRNREAILSFEQLSGTDINADLLRGRELYGACPANFTRPADGKGCFGFYISYGGVLSVVLYRTYADLAAFRADDMPIFGLFTADQVFRKSIIAFPLLRVTHYAGTIDRNPSYDPATGLYFSSNRDGKYNLYLVPKELLSLPEWLAMP